MGNTTKDPSDALVLAVEEVDLPPTTAGVVSVVERVLEKPYVTEIHIQDNAPIRIKWYRAPGDTLLDVHEETPDFTLSRIHLEESDDYEGEFTRRLLDITAEFAGDSLEMTHIICHSKKAVAKSLGFPNPRYLGGTLGSSGAWVPAIFGAPLVESGDCPEGWVVVCGGTGGRLNSVTRGIKTIL